MVNARRLVIGVPLLVVAGIAGQAVYSSKVAGDMVAAHWDSGNLGVVDIIPADTPDGRAYSVFWRGCTLHPDFEHRYCTFAAGLAPRSAFKLRGANAMEVTLDASALSVIFMTGGEDCRSGACIPFVPLSVPLNGTFTVYTGPGSYSEQTHGSARREDILPFGGISSMQVFNGTRTRYSAVFAGIVGPLTVVPGPMGPNAQLTSMHGQQSFQTVYPPTP